MEAKVKKIIMLSWDDNKLNPPTDSTSIFHLENLLKNLKGLDETFEIVFEVGNTETDDFYINSGITNNWLIACHCMACSQHAAAVLFASIAVECVLNCDKRLQNYKQNFKDCWIMLNMDNLREAYNQKLPTNILCEEGENLNQAKNIRFITRRNKIAHGDMRGFAKIPTMIKLSDTKTRTIKSLQPKHEAALNQIKKAKEFIKEWTKLKPIIIH